jgi:hypothetical protein
MCIYMCVWWGGKRMMWSSSLRALSRAVRFTAFFFIYIFYFNSSFYPNTFQFQISHSPVLNLPLTLLPFFFIFILFFHICTTLRYIYCMDFFFMQQSSHYTTKCNGIYIFVVANVFVSIHWKRGREK